MTQRAAKNTEPIKEPQTVSGIVFVRDVSRGGPVIQVDHQRGNMLTAEDIAIDCVTHFAAKVNMTIPQREEFVRYMVRKLDPVVPSVQKWLTFADNEAFKGHCLAILQLLKQRRSAGATNWELAEISLKYTSRISDLRNAKWKILCEREGGRTYRYRLSPTDY